ncbi:Hypothetical protein GbCGDNIH9_8414 [Granulibacter bethesdensis]|uniref:Uncharacterized protein n=1 Tax=Granulibacter bethesdensis TaxID=364410 RepID=A0AAC9K9P8_9PROT|nr:hypothetical protein [Granulibacter bethesdensis]APH53619.1 Hypothetical protein GbCGDNIH9_8414 [Granulibacter bethesdensis]APH61197.1 Hypothetical protein GbCGDNIH8_8414 [Granulibacter bethesdensis]
MTITASADQSAFMQCKEILERVKGIRLGSKVIDPKEDSINQRGLIDKMLD